MPPTNARVFPTALARHAVAMDAVACAVRAIRAFLKSLASLETVSVSLIALASNAVTMDAVDSAAAQARALCA